jgi:hypothetical protein
MLRNLHIFMIIVGIVLIWRGIWGLADIYLNTEDPRLGLIISILIGVTILMLTNRHKNDISELL